MLTYDANKAKELWARPTPSRRGAARSPSPTTPTVATRRGSTRSATASRTRWASRREGKPYPTFAALRKDVTARTITGAFRTGWQADYPGLYDFLQPLYYTEASSNDGDYSNPELDKLINEAASARRSTSPTSCSTRRRRSCSRTCRPSRCGTRTCSGGYSQNVSQRVDRLGLVPLYYAIYKK